MKIKVIDSLVKVANGKLPNDIKAKYDNSTSKWDKKDFLHNFYEEFGNRSDNTIIEFLNDYVEIIEESKKIEKCKNYEDFLEIDDYIEHLKNKINELIDEISNLKEK